MKRKRIEGGFVHVEGGDEGRKLDRVGKTRAVHAGLRVNPLCSFFSCRLIILWI